MEGSLKIGRILGIPIYLHFTFLLVIPLFAWIIGSQIETTVQLLAQIFSVTIDSSLITTGPAPYLLGALIALGLFAGVLVHEVAHSVIAKKRGIRINNITLFLFGGVSSMEEGTPDPKVELPMALAGPLTSLGLGILSIGIIYLIPLIVESPAIAGVLIFLFAYTGLLNVILFAFNLLPAFPMDGGRVLRAFLAQRMPATRATRIASEVGKGFAVFFGIFGFLAFNPILIIIAFFIYIGASQESSAVRYTSLLQDLTLGAVMSTAVMTVSPQTPVLEMLDQMYATKHLGFPVVDRGIVVGMITLSDLHRASPIDRDALQVRDLMTREVVSLPPQAPVAEALRVMSERNIGRIPVLENTELVGLVTRTDIIKVMQLREV
ncbi:CBS domain-containing protein [Methanosphaerula palustris]|uniref:Zinc metalloprotease n=1 Tax=Methanosphaerula palustris (strain ATCC BAA-1556 / DSM 19958 / E1-9c) TaxID=521011 RepID=B8GIW9_METPE|nr:CBS domain-containing protein [Methanosphaerula palustris]ACL15542.1 CBS domain containing protein [Methanosphaerula palustris E1-9c]